jgi:O-antigen/teichoic acid export membrane protein
MDKIQITNICGAGDNAIYSMAYSVGAVVTLLLSSMNEAYVPWFADQLSVGNEKEIRKVGKIYQTAFAIGAIGIMLVAPEVLYLLGGEKYSVAKNVLAPVTMGCVFQFFYTMYVNLEQAKKKTVGMAIGSISAAVLNYILNALFIPRFGYIAAAYTTVASYLWLYIIHVILVARLGYLRVYDLRYEIAILCFAMITCIGINLLYDIFFGRLIVIFIYSILLTVVLIIKKDIILSFVKRIRTRG